MNISVNVEQNFSLLFLKEKITKKDNVGIVEKLMNRIMRIASIQDERGYNQIFAPSYAMDIRTSRRKIKITEEITAEPILEIGCGMGELSYLLSQNKKIIGIDISRKFIERAKTKYPSIDFLAVSWEDFNTPEKFGSIVGNGILHHFDSLDEGLKKIHSFLKSDGKAIFWEPNLLNPFCYLLFNYFRGWGHLEPQQMAFSKKTIIRKLRQAGFSKITVEYRDFLLPNTPKMLIPFVVKAGGILEKIPFVKILSQSLFISAIK